MKLSNPCPLQQLCHYLDSNPSMTKQNYQHDLMHPISSQLTGFMDTTFHIYMTNADMICCCVCVCARVRLRDLHLSPNITSRIWLYFR